METYEQRSDREGTEAFLKAVEEKAASLEMLSELPPDDDVVVVDLQKQLEDAGRLDYRHIIDEATGFYFFKLFLQSEYEAPKAIFVKDWEYYRNMRFESARRQVARILYERFVAVESEAMKVLSIPEKLQDRSTFEIMKVWDAEKIGDDDDVAAAAAAAAAEAAANDNTRKPLGAREESFTLSRLPNQAQGLHIGNTNGIGVYGDSIVRVKELIEEGQAPTDLFDEIAEDVLNDLTLDVFPRFRQSSFFRKYLQTKWMETRPVSIDDFTTFRVLGRGGFGAVYAGRKNNSGAIYAIKFINKKLVKAKGALQNIMLELDVIKMVNSPFVSNLKYAFSDTETLYIVMDLLQGGDLKYHLIEEGRFPEKRVRFYAAQILLALEHLHSKSIIYRDLKLENVILDAEGNAHLVDLGLAVVSSGKVDGYAGTPGYCAPEMVANHKYNYSVDVFSYGVLIYRMLRGSKPFTGRSVDDLDRAVLRKKPDFNSRVFANPKVVDLLTGLLEKNPQKRLGCGGRGLDQVKEHPFFESIDWGLLEAGYVAPPFAPKQSEVNAPKAEEIGDFETSKLEHIRLGTEFEQAVKSWNFVSAAAVQDELVQVIEKAHENVSFEKFNKADDVRDDGVASGSNGSGSSGAKGGKVKNKKDSCVLQ